MGRELLVLLAVATFGAVFALGYGTALRHERSSAANERISWAPAQMSAAAAGLAGTQEEDSCHQRTNYMLTLASLLVSAVAAGSTALLARRRSPALAQPAAARAAASQINRSSKPSSPAPAASMPGSQGPPAARASGSVGQPTFERRSVGAQPSTATSPFSQAARLPPFSAAASPRGSAECSQECSAVTPAVPPTFAAPGGCSAACSCCGQLGACSAARRLLTAAGPTPTGSFTLEGSPFTLNTGSCSDTGAPQDGCSRPGLVPPAARLPPRDSATGGEGSGRTGGAGSGAATLRQQLEPSTPPHGARELGTAGSSVEPSPLRSPAEVERAGSLPQHLKKWFVDAGAIQFLRSPSGQLVQLGRGASSRVLKATLNHEVVAAKVIDIARSSELATLFLIEASRLHRLRHPHIVGFFGIALLRNKGVLLMEHMEGRDLYGKLQLTARGSPGERLYGWHRRGKRVALDVAKALNYMHGKGIVHCDVKSGNVLLTSTGTSKLGDVGLARRHGPAPAADVTSPFGRSRSLEHEEGLPGTLSHVAPEALMGSTPTPASDIYSFGVLLWEILTGERPQRGNLRLPRVPQECPQEVCDMMMQCLAIDAGHRPAAAQLLHQLDKLQ